MWKCLEMKKHIVILSTLIALGIGFVIFGYRQQHNVGTQKSEVNTQQGGGNHAPSKAILPGEHKDAQGGRVDTTPVETQEEIEREIIDNVVATEVARLTSIFEVYENLERAISSFGKN